MNYILIAVGIYALLTLLAYLDMLWWLEGWVWRFAALALGVAAVTILIDPGLWYLGLGTGGLSVFAQRLDDLLMVKADEAMYNTTRGRR